VPFDGPEASIGFDRAEVWLTPAGVRLFDVSVNACASVDRIEWQHVFRVDARGRLELVPWKDPDLETLGWWSPGGGGYLYSVDPDGLVAWNGADLVRGIGGPRTGRVYDIDGLGAVVHDAHATVGLYDGRLVRLVGAGLEVLDPAPPPDLQLHAVDGRGRVLATVHDEVRRLDGGIWETLHPEARR
jgi:hypothetical protein